MSKANTLASRIGELSCSALLALLPLQPQALHAASNSLDRTPAKQYLARGYGSLPLSFEKNLGQAGRDVKYLARGAGYSIELDKDEATLLLAHHEVTGGSRLQQLSRKSATQLAPAATADMLQLRLIGHSPKVAVSGESRQEVTVNYFAGNNPAKWLSGVPTYERVKYADVYPGVDLTYYGSGQRLEFDFDLAPGTDPRLIRLRFDGAQNVRLDKSGNLTIVAPDGEVSFRKPSIYQLSGENSRQSIEGSFRIVSRHTVAFTIGRYDHSKPLVIDPILNYSTYLGQVGEANAIAVDAAGDAYVTGWAQTGMPTTTGAIQASPVTKSGSATESAFVAKLNSTGTALIYCTYLSGSGDDDPVAISVDSQGNAYLAGGTTSADFPTTPGAFQPVDTLTPNQNPPGSFEGTGFLAKINSTGTALVYSTYLGGSTSGSIYGMAVDASGNAYVTGYTYASDFPTTKGAFQTTTNAKEPNPTGFVTKMNPTGTGLVYSTFLGGSTYNPTFGAEDYGAPTAIAVDAAGNAYITGSTGSSDFPITPGAFQSTYKSSVEIAFLTKLNPAGTGLVYSTYLGGTSNDGALAIGVDSSGDAYLTGFTQSGDFPTTPGAFEPTFPPFAAQNAFVTKFNPTGTAVIYSSLLGGEYDLSGLYIYDTTAGTAIAVDASGNAYVTGNTSQIDFPVTFGSFEPVNRSQLVSVDSGAFMTEFNPSGSQLLYSTYLSGSGNAGSYLLNGYGSDCDCGNGIALDSSNNVYVTGYTASVDFPITPGAYQTTNTSATQGNVTFVTEFNSSEMKPLPQTTTTVTSSENSVLPGIPVTFTAKVQGAAGGSMPTGFIAFNVETASGEFPFTPWQLVNLDGSGSATYTTNALVSGPNAINAYYLGDSNNAPSSGSLTENILYFPTVTTVTASANSAVYGAGITFTATVLESSGNPAKGIVFFEWGGIVYKHATLDSNGQATWASSESGSALLPGTDTVTVQFFESSEDQASSGLVTVIITPLGVTQSPTFSPPAGTYSSTQQVFLNDPSPGAEIYYTTDGSTPVVGSRFQTPSGFSIPVNTSETIQAIAVEPGYSASPVASATYVIDLPTPDFGVVLNPTSLTVNSGGSGTSTLNVTAVGGFSGSVSFACSGLPVGATCSFSPASVPAGNSSNLTIMVAASASNGSRSRFPFAPVTFVALAFAWFRLRRRTWTLSLQIVVLAVVISSLTSCSGGGASNGVGGRQNPPPITSNVTVTATSGTLSHTATLALTVN